MKVLDFPGLFIYHLTWPDQEYIFYFSAESAALALSGLSDSDSFLYEFAFGKEGLCMVTV